MSWEAPVPRREIHHRVIVMRTYARENGPYAIEAHLLERKPVALKSFHASEAIPAGQTLHDLWVRVTGDRDYVVRRIEAASHEAQFGRRRELHAPDGNAGSDGDDSAAGNRSTGSAGQSVGPWTRLAYR